MTTPTNPGGPARVPTDRLTLEFPRSLAVFDTYEEAQRAVDYLSDHEFPVQNVLIVGTDLKQVERVTGRLTWGKVVAGGLLSGMWLGAFVGLIFSMFGEGFAFALFLSVVLTGAVFGVVWASIGYAFTRGRRDFTSVSQVVATRYEVLVEHALYDQARETLARLPGGHGRTAPVASPQAARPDRPNPYEGRYGVRTDDAGASGGSAGAGPSGGASAAPRPDEAGPREPHPNEPRPNAYEGRYGVRLPEGERPAPPADEDAPPNPRD